MYLQQCRTGDLFLDEEKALNTASKKLHFSNSKKGWYITSSYKLEFRTLMSY